MIAWKVHGETRRNGNKSPGLVMVLLTLLGPAMRLPAQDAGGVLIIDDLTETDQSDLVDSLQEFRRRLPDQPVSPLIGDRDTDAIVRLQTSTGATVDPVREPISQEQLLAAIVKDARSSNNRHLRYLSVTHLYNAAIFEYDAIRLKDRQQRERLKQSRSLARLYETVRPNYIENGYTVDECTALENVYLKNSVDEWVHGIAKLINSLSWSESLVQPTIVAGTQSTVVSIDLSKLGWSTSLWDRVTASYPYTIGLGPRNKEGEDATGTWPPYIRADWFATIATKPQVYHLILRIPDTTQELEKKLGVDVRKDLACQLASPATRMVWRAGFVRSTPSHNNRVIERHEAAHGCFWKSYDFASSSGRQNISERPLGPGFSDAEFRHDGEEIVFSLPNGLNGYMLANAAGRRLDKAPTNIVTDSKAADGIVRNGLSCIRCHDQGFKDVAFSAESVAFVSPSSIREQYDRTAAVVDTQLLAKVRAIYPPVVDVNTILTRDGTKFLKSLHKLGMTDRPAIEPVSRLVALYESTVSPYRAAAELWLSPEQLMKTVGRSPHLTRAIGVVVTLDGVSGHPLTIISELKRDTFETEYAQLVTFSQSAVKTPVVSRVSGSIGLIFVCLNTVILVSTIIGCFWIGYRRLGSRR